jgi:hypothetical protein
MSSRTSDECGVVIRDTKEALRDTLREAKEHSEQKLAELKQHAEHGIQQLEQHAPRLFESNVMTEEEANLPKNTLADAAEEAFKLRKNSDEAKQKTEAIIIAAHERTLESFDAVKERLGMRHGSPETVHHAEVRRTQSLHEEAEPKGIFERIGEKLEQLGESIRDKVVGIKDKTTDELEDQRERMHSMGHQLKESAKDVKDAYEKKV